MPSSASAGRQRAHEVLEAVCDLFERHPAILAQVGDELGPETDEQRVAGVVGVCGQRGACLEDEDGRWDRPGRRA
jgi:hypothetical protein